MWAECNIFLLRAGLYFRKSQKTIIAHFAIFAVETALSRKLNRVPPLRDVFDLLTLVNLMNQFRGVIDQTHRRLTRHARAAQPVVFGLPTRKWSTILQYEIILSGSIPRFWVFYEFRKT